MNCSINRLLQNSINRLLTYELLQKHLQKKREVGGGVKGMVVEGGK
jgi:hypothetical protein